MELKIPTKQKILVWKISWEYLPTFVNLFSRRICSSSLCPGCGSGAETVSHVFRECPGSVEVWSSLHYDWVLSKQELHNWNWITWLFKEASAEKCMVICYSSWTIWNERNKVIHEKQWHRGVDIARRIMALVEEN